MGPASAKRRNDLVGSETNARLEPQGSGRRIIPSAATAAVNSTPRVQALPGLAADLPLAPDCTGVIRPCTIAVLTRSGDVVNLFVLRALFDPEIVGAWRIRSVLASNGAALQPYDQDRWAATFRYAAADPFESIDLFRAVRANTLSLLRRVDSALYENYGVHGERGRETVSHIVRLYAGHDRNHLGQIERLLAAAPRAAFAPAPVEPPVQGNGIPLDVRAGTIEAIEAIAESRKLMKLTVSFGDHRRTIVAGIRQERSDPQALVSRQALFIVNIPPRTLAGVESQGMLFDLGHADGLTPVLAIPEATVPDGTRAG